VLLLTFVICASVQAQIVQTSQTRLVDFFPRTQQGENGIYLQSRGPAGEYYDLTNVADYGFLTIGTQWNLPDLGVVSFDNGEISAHPAHTLAVGVDRDPVMRVTLNGNFGSVRITGNAYTANVGEVRYYIYKGENGYNTPIWQSMGAGSFDFVLSYIAGEQIFFATDAGSSDGGDWARWTDIRFQGQVPEVVPEPSSALVLGSSLFGLIPVLRRRIGR